MDWLAMLLIVAFDGRFIVWWWMLC